jgi:hypothetical protein
MNRGERREDEVVESCLCLAEWDEGSFHDSGVYNYSTDMRKGGQLHQKMTREVAAHEGAI